MTTGLYRKGLVLVIIGLFIGAGVVPSISENVKNVSNVIELEDSITSYTDDQLDQYSTKELNVMWSLGKNYRMPQEDSVGAQSFIPTLNVLTRVELYEIEDAEPLGHMVVSIRNTLYGDDLTSVTKYPTSGGRFGWYIFDFPDIEVTPGDTYYIVAYAYNDGLSEEDGWWWGSYQSEDIYARGDGYYSTDGGNSFNILTCECHDFCFKTYGYNAEGNLPPSVIITYPESGDTVNGEITIAGTASDPNGNDDLEYVMVQPPGMGWETAYGT